MYVCVCARAYNGHRLSVLDSICVWIGCRIENRAQFSAEVLTATRHSSASLKLLRLNLHPKLN